MAEGIHQRSKSQGQEADRGEVGGQKSGSEWRRAGGRKGELGSAATSAKTSVETIQQPHLR